MNKLLPILSGLALSFIISSEIALGTELKIYPVSGVFTSENIKSSEYKTFITSNLENVVNNFKNSIKNSFKNSVDEISDNNRFRTLAVYESVPRASVYKVSKPDGILDIYMPLTMSINFANMATGEILYTSPYTVYHVYETTTDKSDKYISDYVINEYTKIYKELEEGLIAKAKTEFSPVDVTTKIIDKSGKFYILDKGLNGGIAKDDILFDEDANELKVVYSDLKYSVAEDVWKSKPSKRNTFTKTTNSGSLSQNKKPKIFFVNNLRNAQLYDIFASELGNKASFTLQTANKTFFDMQTVVVGMNKKFQLNKIYNRSLPNYFINLYRTLPSALHYQSDVIDIEKYQQTACAVITDITGRVVYSTCATDILDRDLTKENSFGENNIEILEKNVLNLLATDIKKTIKFKKVKFKILDIKKDRNYIIVVDNKNGYLKAGVPLHGYKKEKVKKANILIPYWSCNIISVENDKAYCQVSGTENKPSKFDIIQYDTISKLATKADLVKYTPYNTKLEGNDFELRSFNDIAFAAIASKLRSPLGMEDSQFESQAIELNALGFKDKIEVKPSHIELNIRPVYKVKLLEAKEISNDCIQYKYNVIVGLIFLRDGKEVKQDARSQDITFVLPKYFNEEFSILDTNNEYTKKRKFNSKTIQKNNAIENKLMMNIYPILQDIASKF